MTREPSILLRWLPRRPRTLLYSFILVPILLFSIFLRFHNLGEMGLDGSDGVWYTTIAKEWSEGNFIYEVQVILLDIALSPSSSMPPPPRSSFSAIMIRPSRR